MRNAVRSSTNGFDLLKGKSEALPQQGAGDECRLRFAASASLSFPFGEETMTLAFEAEWVDCADAMDGEILQVTLDTIAPDHDEDERCTPYVRLSQNFEFPGPATIEWHDGKDYDGARIVSLILSRSRVVIKLDRDLDIEAAFRLDDGQFARLKSFLTRMIDECVCSIE